MKRRCGPRTVEGKERVRLNPLKHGRLAQTPVIPVVEREEDWQRLRLGIHESFDVVGTLEEQLADIVAMSFWRRWRVVRFETEAISSAIERVPEDFRRMRALREPQGER